MHSNFMLPLNHLGKIKKNQEAVFILLQQYCMLQFQPKSTTKKEIYYNELENTGI